VLTVLDAILRMFVDVRRTISFFVSCGAVAVNADARPHPAQQTSYSGSMFVRSLSIQRIDAAGAAQPCPIRWIDNFAMRNFTNDAVFDDTLPVGDGWLEAGHRVPLDRLRPAMEDWFRRKGYLKPGERLEIVERNPPAKP